MQVIEIQVLISPTNSRCYFTSQYEYYNYLYFAFSWIGKTMSGFRNQNAFLLKILIFF